MDGLLYGRLSVMVYLQFAIWGAWLPVLAARLMGPLKFSAKQSGWIYSSFAIASLIAPMLAGQIADQWIAAEWFLAGAHLIGAILLLMVSKEKTFPKVFITMFFYCLCYAATLPLMASLMFTQLGKVYTDKALLGDAAMKMFLWAPVAWVLSGWILTAWRRRKGTGDGSDCLKLAAGFSFVMALYCLTLPHTPPKGVAAEMLPFLEALSMLKDTNFLIFIILSFAVSSLTYFYFLGTARFLGDIGVHSNNIPAVMTFAQVVEIIAKLVLFGLFMKYVGGYNWAFAIGTGAWLVLMLSYAVGKPKWFVIIAQGLHGIGYTFFMNGGQIYVNSVATPETVSSAQGLITVVTQGLGVIVGAQVAGFVMDHFKAGDKFQWRKIFLVPCTALLICVLAFIFIFKG